MKVSEQWLRELVDPSLTIETIAEKLTFAGVELDGIAAVCSDFSKVVVGQITAVEQHPDADRLKVCHVDVGGSESLQIVTNVASVASGQKVPVAMVGAQLPKADGSIFKIKKSRLRGVLSQGMFCGAETLGIDETSDTDLLPIPENAVPGADVRDVLLLNDSVLDLDITPNRADCLSMIGIAREVGVLTETDVTELIQTPVEAVHEDTLDVDIIATEACKRYAGRVIHGVNSQATTPDWMVRKLQRAGLRSLSAIVDITNFVLLELGQPLHAFDMHTLEGELQVRMAREGEQLQLLDGNTVALQTDSLVVADANGAQALAGIMGGLPTAVTDETESIFLESAYFTPESIAGKARSYGLHTDSSHRFERGVSPDLQVRAIERATQLILDICGGKPGKVTDLLCDAQLLVRRPIHLREQRISRLLGLEIPVSKVESILLRLGCEVSRIDAGWEVTPPVFRFDMVREVDLIEELARIHGYDKIPATLRKMTPRVVQPSETNLKLEVLHNVLTSRGYQEVINYSFVDEKTEKQLAPDVQPVKLANPISTELAVMRTTLWPGLLKNIVYNVKRQQSRVRVFETGLTFVKTAAGELVQRKKISGAITGAVVDPQWALPSTDVDFYDIKGDVEALLSEAVGNVFEFEAATHPGLHPGQSARICFGGEVIGWVGALHPRLEKDFELGQGVYLFELDVEPVSQQKLPAYTKISTYPATQRDLALLVEKNISYADIERVIKKSEIVQLVDYYLFDSYSGEGIPDGYKSLALSLIFQDVSRTLEETEITTGTNTLVTMLEQQTGAVLRN